jgi:hypothetical protein
MIQFSNSRYASALSRHSLPELCWNGLSPSPIRGSRKCRGRAAPAVSCAKLCEKTHTSIQVQRRHPGIPCAMALRLMPRSPRRRIHLVTVAAGLMAVPIRSDRSRHRQLDTSNGCRDHTVLPYALAPFVLRAVARSRKTALRTHARRRHRVHRILSHVRDDARPPLLPGKDGASW